MEKFKPTKEDIKRIEDEVFDDEDIRKMKELNILPQTKPSSLNSTYLQFRKNPTNELYDALVLKIYPLIISILRPILRSGELLTPFDREDLIQVAYEGFVKAVKSHDPSVAQFSTFATIKIRGAILDELRKWRKGKQLRSYFTVGMPKKRKNNYIINESNFNDLDGIDTTTNLFQHFICTPKNKLEEYEEFVKLLEILDPMEDEIINLYYRKGITLKEIAKRWKLSESRVSQLHSAILSKIHLCIRRRDNDIKFRFKRS